MATQAAGQAWYGALETPFGEGLVAWTSRGVVALESYAVPGAVPPGSRGTVIAFCDLVASIVGEPPARGVLPAAMLRGIELGIEGHTEGAPVDLGPFAGLRRDVYRSVMRIPRGTVWSYADVAADIGRPRAYRAVGTALRRCPIDFLVPAHRVISASGAPGGWSSGTIAFKRRLLEREGVRLPAR